VELKETDPMSAELARSAIERFLKSSEPEILCIKGAWGSGKTYAWNHFSKEIAKSSNIPLTVYSYCSLFGVNTVEDLKQSIFENSVPTETLRAATPTTIRAKAQWLTRRTDVALIAGQRLLSAAIERVGGKAAAELVRLSTFWLVRDQIVVVDDIERKGEKLSIEAVLGLLSFLKEQRSCKCVLILNAEKLGQAKAAYERYLEKVVDISLTFAPSPTECADIVFGRSDAIEIRLRSLCTLVGLTNIRVLTRIKKLATHTAPLFKDRDPRVLDEALKTLVLLAWIHFCPDEAPDVEFVTKRYEKRTASIVRKEQVPTSPVMARWHEILDQLGSNDLTEFDRSLLQGIQDGYFNETEISELVSKFELQLRNSDAQAAFHGAWNLFHNGFGDDERELVSLLISGVKAGVDLVTPSNLDASIRLLRGLGHDEEANALITYYVDHHSGGQAFFTLRPGHPFDAVNDDVIRRAFQLKAASLAKVRSAAEVLTAIGSFRTDAGDQQRLLQFSIQELQDGFKSLGGSTRKDAIEILLGNQEAAVNGQTVASNAKAALQAISRENRLNARRVENLIK
jgi:hypothetical protein